MKLKVSSKSWIIFSTAIIIGIAFSAYFLVYVKGNEKDIVSNNFRVLKQIALNIKSLEKSFLKNAESDWFNSQIDSIGAAKNKSSNKKIKAPDANHSAEAKKLYTADEHNKILYGNHELFLRVDPLVDLANENDPAYYFTPYDAIYDNELITRTDVFDQIIITKIKISKQGEICERDLLFSNGLVGIMDSAYYQKTLQSARDEIMVNDKRYISFNQLTNDSKLLINGLVLKSTFEQQKRSVSPHLIFALSIALILIILAMPFLKLKIMSLEERLHIKDVVFSVLSIIIGPAIFIVFLSTTFVFLNFEKEHIQNHLALLSQNVESNFQKELEQINNQIDTLNKHFFGVSDLSVIDAESNEFKLDSVSEIRLNKLGKPINFKNNQYEIDGFKVIDSIIDSPSITFKHLKSAFWCSDKAKTLVFLSVFNHPAYFQDLSHRKYITNINDNKPNFYEDTSGKIHEIAIESIKSVSDGSYEVGIGKSTEGRVLPVLAISTKMASTIGTIMEEGYGFCIMDKEGNTVFHSDIMKNMNENFINETHGVFIPSIVSHTDMYETVNYNGNNQTIYFRPLGCLSGHYIATFVIPEVHYGPVILSTISAFIMFLCFLIFILFVSSILYFSNFKLTKLKQIIYVFNFIRPYETDIFYKKYKRLIVVSLAIILYLILSIIFNGHHYDFIISELALVILVMLVCSLYSFSNGLHKQYLIHSGIRDPSKNFYYPVVLIIIFIFFGIRVYSIIIKEASDAGLIINSIGGLFFALFIVTEVLFDKKIIKLKYLEKSAKNPSQIQRTYVKFLMLWVFILSIIPINLFLKITIQKENEIFAKFRSRKVMENIQIWDDDNHDEFADKFYKPKNYNRFIKSMGKDSINYAMVETNFEIDSINAAISDSKDEVKINSESRKAKIAYRMTKMKYLSEEIFDTFYKSIRPNYNDRTSITKSFIGNVASDTTWIFSTSNDMDIFTLIPKFKSESSITSVTIPKSYFFKSHWLFLLMVTAISIVLFFNFLNFILIKIYGFNYKKYADKSGIIDGQTFSTYFLADKYFSNNSSYNNIFIVSVNSAHTTFIKDHFNKSNEDNYLSLDFYDFSEKLDVEIKGSSSYKDELKLNRFERDREKIIERLEKSDKQIYVLVEHFEFGYNDVRLNKMKLEILKYLVDCKNFKVLVKSEINTTKFLNFYEDSILNINNLLKKSNAEDRIMLLEMVNDLKIDYKKWQHLLGSFVNCIIPINLMNQKVETIIEKKPVKMKEVETGKELEHGEFLDMLGNYLKETSVLDLPDEDKILTVQQMSYPYYFSVWNSLSKEERYIVYDIAKDRFVNTVNTNAILSLLKKGILVYDHSLRLMNESFADFILTTVNSDEALELEMLSRKKGTWSTAFAVIILLIISLVIFLSMGQQNFLNDINAFLTGIAALVGLLIRFSGFLSFGGNRGAPA